MDSTSAVGHIGVATKYRSDTFPLLHGTRTRQPSAVARLIKQSRWIPIRSSPCFFKCFQRHSTKWYRDGAYAVLMAPGSQPGMESRRAVEHRWRPSNEGMAQILFSSQSGCNPNRQLVDQRRRWESNPLPLLCRQLPGHLAPAPSYVQKNPSSLAFLVRVSSVCLFRG